jgi:elongator complex protein 1
MALVDHLKGMSLATGAQKELRSLLVVLTQLQKEDTARQVQLAGDNFEVSQMAAVKLAEETISTDKIDENAHTLEYYTKMLRAHQPTIGETSSWRIKVLSPP